MRPVSIRKLAVAVFFIGSVLLLTACAQTAQPVTLRVGDTAPAFTLPNALGGNVSLSDYVGKKPVLLYFSMTAG